ncbi:putative beta-lysine N-acetyltransferase [Metabacillus iocasae]|uniref:Beta-lysine N-acetyltransferase n=1 Tax=Priestia iocasae TaxID=2291674 RepID=A0ABS2QW59_9BACI|nr:putative beta-lysine N-acetyltransferase [Metabacillus iocasae]MBM7703182.1 putative beta-lysine N-acetyltransferase [Metabacillus iocasae]
MNVESVYKEICIREQTFFLRGVCDYFNQRLRVEDYRGNVKEAQAKVEELVRQSKFGKVIVKVRYEQLEAWIEQGFQVETTIPAYFNGHTAYCLAKYFEATRRKSDQWIKEDEIVSSVQQLPSRQVLEPLSSNYTLRKATVNDAQALVSLYQAVFQIYPTPLYEVSYLQDLLKSGGLFYVIEYEGEIVSAASADINYTYHNAELTDCATLPDHRQGGFMKHLLTKLEEALKEKSIFCSYTIARSLSFGINAAFHQLGYTYCGRFTNNCYIYDNLEDMNVWVKDLSQVTNT